MLIACADGLCQPRALAVLANLSAETTLYIGPPILLFNRMVKYYDDPLSTVFSALADPTRRAILARLALGETTVGELAEPFDMSLPAVSKHLKILEGAGLLARARQGRVHRCQLDGRALQEAANWIQRYRVFWNQQFDALAEHLERPGKHKKSNPSGG